MVKVVLMGGYYSWLRHEFTFDDLETASKFATMAVEHFVPDEIDKDESLKARISYDVVLSSTKEDK